MPESTDARRASDGLTAGFGAGTNGPLLISVDLSKQPAKADQKQTSTRSPSRSRTTRTRPTSRRAAGAAARSAGAAARAGPGAGPAATRQADRPDRAAVGASARRSSSRRPIRGCRTSRRTIAKTAGVKKVTEPLVNKDGTAAVLNATPTTDPSDRATADLVQRLRDTTVPKAEKGNDMTVNVGGQTANYVDLASEIASRLIITDRGRRRAELRAADAGLPLDRDPAHGRADEPGLDRRRLRRRDRGVREGLGRGPRRARRARCRSSRSCR